MNLLCVFLYILKKNYIVFGTFKYAFLKSLWVIYKTSVLVLYMEPLAPLHFIEIKRSHYIHFLLSFEVFLELSLVGFMHLGIKKTYSLILVEFIELKEFA